MNDQPMEMRVMARSQLAEGIVGLELADVAGSALPGWTPGAHIDVATQDRGGRPVFRPYSLCGPAQASTWRIAVRDEVGGRGGSRWLHQAVVPGQTLRVRGPRNHFPLVEATGTVLLFAGGIGITPLIAMARHLLAQRRDFRLHYHVRDLASAAFLDELRSQPLSARSAVWPDDAAPPRIEPLFAGVGQDASVYVCGPAGYMDAVTRCARQAGLADSRIHREHFSAPAAAESDSVESRAFVVRLASNGREIPVAHDQTVVQALEAAGVPMIVSCEQGHCGSCLTRVIDGIPDHRDHFLLPEEQARNDSFTPCCSRSLTPCLVLDL